MKKSKKLSHVGWAIVEENKIVEIFLTKDAAIWEKSSYYQTGKIIKVKITQV
jgi:hypothetical protein